MNKTLRSVRLFIIGLVCLLGITSFCGCSMGKPMALETKSGALELESESVGLFTLRTSNQYKPGFQPAVMSIEAVSDETDKKVVFRAAKHHSHEKKRFYEYLVSVDLSPGIYRVGKIAGSSTSFLFHGSFAFPVGASFELPPDSVVYLGHINMVNRKRNKGEKRSGSIFPLVDQGVSGYGDGTFDITISDRSDTDIQLFEQAYPELAKHIVMKNIMKN